MKRNFLKWNLLVLSSVLMSCGHDATTTDDGNNSDSTATQTDTVGKTNTSEISYQIPSPDDMFSLIKQASIKGKNTSMLNPTTIE